MDRSSGNPEPTNLDIEKLIEDLLFGEGSELFRELERSISHFCPFEAIGMVHQEIRHAHFLSYIIDPNRAHPFKDDFLKSILQEAYAQSQIDQTSLHPLEIHCADYSSALVYRERANIDLLIEATQANRKKGQKGLVIAVELKVHAAESQNQLEKYRNQVLAEYPINDWDHVFVFLTLDATPPSEKNKENWIPISLLDLISRFDAEVELHELSGEAVGLYRKYSAMIRRNLVDDEQLAQLSRKIWGKHKDALEALYKYRPDLQAEIIDWIRKNASDIARDFSVKTGLTILPDTSTTRILRFYVKEWLGSGPIDFSCVR